MEILMNGFEQCPSCRSQVEIIHVKRPEQKSNYYFVNCKSCGEGTKEAYDSLDRLKNVWNHWAAAERIN